jgi:hypothetical protein
VAMPADGNEMVISMRYDAGTLSSDGLKHRCLNADRGLTAIGKHRAGCADRLGSRSMRPASSLLKPPLNDGKV